MTRAMRRHGWLWAASALLIAAVLALAACGDDDDGGGGTAAAVSGTISVAGVWSGQEEESFKAVIAAFNEQQPDVTVNYTSAGDQLPTVLSTAVQGGNPPDIAMVAQPGAMRDFVTRNALQPIEFARDDAAANFSESIVGIGEVDGTLYGLLFKAANKSLGWYNVPVFEDAGVEPPETWEDLPDVASTISASGVTPYSVAGADGWTLTDLFENLYLRIAGGEKYDQLAAHEIPWTDPTVVETLEQMRVVLGDPANIAGGYRGALQTDFPTSVAQVFTDPPKAAMTFEGDFVASVISDETSAEPETGFNSFPFPSVGGSEPAVMGGGDIAIMFKDSPAGQAFIRFLTTPEAAEAWAERGGYLSANTNLDPAVYPDEITRTAGTALQDAELFRFDLSDLQPAAFGGTAGQGMWKLLQDFMRNPDDAQAIAQQLETAAARAYR